MCPLPGPSPAKRVDRRWPEVRPARACALQVHITLNKNSVPGDKSAITPGGMRIGTPAMTTRGFVEKDFVRVADLIDRAIGIAKDLKATTPAPSKMKEFRAYLADQTSREDIQALKAEVLEFSSAFPMPGN